MSPNDWFDLSGTVAIVTGGTRGIGRAISTGLAASGAKVVPTSRTDEDVADAVSAVESRGVESLHVTTDVAADDDVEALVERTVDEFGRLDVLVNNAGINPAGALGRPEDVDLAEFDRTMSVNLRGGFACTKAAAPYLLEADDGNVINVASVGGLVGLPRQHPYVASKHGLVGMTKSMALDWAPDVRVNAIAPGYVATELTEELRSNEGLRQSIVERTPLDRFAEPREIAGPAVFLASEAGSFVTGACLTVDGGWTAR